MSNEIASPPESNAEPGFLDAPGLPGMAPPAAQPAGYRVLARKYRPSHFGDLIGQDAMVRTLTNAFASGRIPQAWMLTGVRGVGKTTTARILARALNFQRADGSGGPTTELGELGVHCQSIIEGRHIDVMEMDAASNTGVDNIRQINDAVRYAPVSARYKVYIIDEVHMLSGGAFNAFLKTLEEPPPHAKFIFATTEIRKVPVTILSRCQRFDLRRVDAELLVSHLAGICRKERVEAEDEALALIARAAEGSVRDSLSLLDQAIAHAGGTIRAEDVRAMLGLADRARVVDLYEMVLKGDLAAALDELKAQYDAGADPLTVMTELAAFTHLVTRLKVTPVAARDPSLTEIERRRGLEFAGVLSIRLLAMFWQVLTRGLPDVRDAARPLAAAEMLLVRLCHAAELPTPDEAIRLLQEGAPAPGGASPAPQGGGNGGGSGGGGAMARAAAPAVARPAARPEPAPETKAAPRLAAFEQVVALARQNRDVGLVHALEHDVRLIRFEEGRIELALETGARRGLVNDLSQRLKDWTGRAWMIGVVPNAEGAGATLRAQAEAARADARAEAAADPVVRAVLASFPGAKIADVRLAGDLREATGEELAETAGEPPPDDDGGFPDEIGEPWYDLDD